MENGTLLAGPGLMAGRNVRTRVSAVVVAVALVFAMFALVQQRADAAPAGPSVAAASVATVAAVGAAQIHFNQIICAALLSIRHAFAHSPFFAFVVAAINHFIHSFGCSPS